MNFSPKLEVNSTGNNTRIIGFCVWNVLRNPNFSEFNWLFYNLKLKNKWISKNLPWYYLKCVSFYRKSIRSIGIVRFLLWIEYVRLRGGGQKHQLGLYINHTKSDYSGIISKCERHKMRPHVEIFWKFWKLAK